jgi:hypothetical protein
MGEVIPAMPESARLRNTFRCGVYSFFGFVLDNQRFVEKVAGFGADREQHGADSVQV